MRSLDLGCTVDRTRRSRRNTCKSSISLHCTHSRELRWQVPLRPSSRTRWISSSSAFRYCSGALTQTAEVCMSRSLILVRVYCLIHARSNERALRTPAAAPSRTRVFSTDCPKSFGTLSQRVPMAMVRAPITVGADLHLFVYVRFPQEGRCAGAVQRCRSACGFPRTVDSDYDVAL